MPIFIGPSYSTKLDESIKRFKFFVASTEEDGVVDITSSDPNLLVPETVTVVGGKAEFFATARVPVDAIVTISQFVDPDTFTSTSTVYLFEVDQAEPSESEDGVTWVVNEGQTQHPTMFLGDKEKDYVKQNNDEIIQRVVNQVVFYYPIDVENSNFHDLYGESILKKFHAPIKVNALVEWKGYDIKNGAYSLDKVPVIEVHFFKRRIEEDLGISVKEGDYVKYGRDFYEITAINENNELFGAFNSKVDVSATCVKARRGKFYVPAN